MTEKKEVIGYYTEDGNIYCIEFIYRNIEILNKLIVLLQRRIQKKTYIFCDECGEKIK